VLQGNICSWQEKHVLLSVIIPVYNEEKTVLEIIERVRHCGVVQLQLIVVNDCSRDGTQARLDSLPVSDDLVIIHHQINQGKGAAIRSAQSLVKGDAVIIQDADLEYDPADYPALLAPIIAGEADVVYGVRDLSAQKPMMRWGNQFLTMLTNLLYGTHLHDMETCYKVMATSVARQLALECNRFDLEPEITAKVARLGCRIAEVPIAYAPREAKKLSPWRDGVPAVRALFRYRSWKPSA